jgi:hypothetical protein
MMASNYKRNNNKSIHLPNIEDVIREEIVLESSEERCNRGHHFFHSGKWQFRLFRMSEVWRR